MIRPSQRTVFIAALGVLFILGAAGCGKIGQPRPKDQVVDFSFSETRVAPVGKCLAVQGKAVGALQNVDRIDLEIAPVDMEGNCPTCPFNAREFGSFTLEEANYSIDTGEFYFSYCPTLDAEMYRWRLVGRNVYSGLPYALTVPLITLMPQ